MEIIAAPGRQLKTVSFWLVVATGLLNLAAILLNTLSDLHAVSAQTIAIVNAVMVFATGTARFVAQQIALTTTQKMDLIKAAVDAPVKPSQLDVTATVIPVTTGPASSTANAERTERAKQYIDAAIEAKFSELQKARKKPGRPRKPLPTTSRVQVTA